MVQWSPRSKGEPSITANHASGVTIGLDAAIVANHQVAVRGPGVREDFHVAPTLAGLVKLTERLRPHAGSVVVAAAAQTPDPARAPLTISASFESSSMCWTRTNSTSLRARL